MKINSLSVIKWTATVLTMVGSLMISFNMPFSKYAFLVFFTGSWFWLVAGIKMKEPSIWVLNIYFVIVNINAIYRWIILP